MSVDILEDLASGTVEDGLRKIAGIAVLQQRLQKTAGASDILQMAIAGLKRGDPLYVGAAGALAGGGLSTLYEASQPAHKRRWSNVLLNAGLAGGLGAAGASLPKLIQEMRSSSPPPERGMVSKLLGGLQTAPAAVGSATEVAGNAISALPVPGSTIPGGALQGIGKGIQGAPFTAAGAAVGGGGLAHRLTAGKNNNNLVAGWNAVRGTDKMPNLARFDGATSNTVDSLNNSILSGTAQTTAEKPFDPSALVKARDAAVQASHDNVAKTLDPAMARLSRSGLSGYLDRARAMTHGIPESGQFTWKEKLPLVNRFSRATSRVIGQPPLAGPGGQTPHPRELPEIFSGIGRGTPKGFWSGVGGPAKALGGAAIPLGLGALADWGASQ